MSTQEMKDFITILTEAKSSKSSSSKPIKIPLDNSKKNDYTEEVDLTDESDELEYNEEGEDEIDNDETTDYTEEDIELEPDEDTSTSDETTDYSDIDDNNDEENIDSESEVNTTEEKTDKERNRILLNDFIRIYHFSKNTIDKISEIDKSNTLINRVCVQVTRNISLTKKIIYDYILYSFPNNKYVQNLYMFNSFVEAIRINLEMMKKMNVFNSNNETNI